MSRGRKILLIVEGEKAEPRLMEHALSVYGITDVEIIPYGQNIYDLYRRMFQDADSVDDLDLLQVLKEREHRQEKRNLLDEYYSDIILIFDFDPQDHSYSASKIQEMAAYFNESTEHGKLYVNYPMVEAYRDLTASPYDAEYADRIVTLKELEEKTYKSSVDKRSMLPQLEDCDFRVLNQILLQNIEKAGLLLGLAYNKTNPTQFYSRLTQEAILEQQSKLLSESAVVSVLCTCLWFAIDYRPDQMSRHLRSFVS